MVLPSELVKLKLSVILIQLTMFMQSDMTRFQFSMTVNLLTRVRKNEVKCVIGCFNMVLA